MHRLTLALMSLQARDLDAHIAREGVARLGPLAGVPVACKVGLQKSLQQDPTGCPTLPS